MRKSRKEKTALAIVCGVCAIYGNICGWSSAVIAIAIVGVISLATAITAQFIQRKRNEM